VLIISLSRRSGLLSFGVERRGGGITVEVLRFTDGGTRYETWELPDAGWDAWATHVDRFLAYAIRGIVAQYAGDQVEWLEISYWQNSGRLIVFPSQDGPHGNRVERVCFELSSEHLEAESHRVSESVPGVEQDEASEVLASRVWHRVSECLARGDAEHELANARQSHKMRVAGYDYNPGEGPFRLAESGALA
jgi:hypothetical protein